MMCAPTPCCSAQPRWLYGNWQLTLHTGGWRYLAGGFFFAGLAMLSKGPVGLVMPGFAVGSHLLLSGRWRDIFRWQWIAGLGVTALVLAPMCLGLWQQFDLHPEKTVDGRTGVSGLYFFFWEQSFGRITGENKWKNDTTVLYFLHVYLWAFLPWCLLLPGAWWRSVKDIFRRKTSFLKENYSIGAFTLTFIALSLSRYKLPHYIFVTMPWAAVLVAAHLNSISVRKMHWAAVYFLGFVGMILTSLILILVFPDAGVPVWTAVLTLKGLLVWLVVRQPFPGRQRCAGAAGRTFFVHHRTGDEFSLLPEFVAVSVGQGGGRTGAQQGHSTGQADRFSPGKSRAGFLQWPVSDRLRSV
jgi:4-amino-4-deoxy-L-arabinose transferase-like glycosyltransferase